MEIEFIDKEITAWGSIDILKQMYDHLGFSDALSKERLSTTGIKQGLFSRPINRDFHLASLGRRIQIQAYGNITSGCRTNEDVWMKQDARSQGSFPLFRQVLAGHE